MVEQKENSGSKERGTERTSYRTKTNCLHCTGFDPKLLERLRYAIFKENRPKGWVISEALKLYLDKVEKTWEEK